MHVIPAVDNHPSDMNAQAAALALASAERAPHLYATVIEPFVSSSSVISLVTLTG
jgi:hypothetical protein